MACKTGNATLSFAIIVLSKNEEQFLFNYLKRV